MTTYQTDQKTLVAIAARDKLSDDFFAAAPSTSEVARIASYIPTEWNAYSSVTSDGVAFFALEVDELKIK